MQYFAESSFKELYGRDDESPENHWLLFNLFIGQCDRPLSPSQSFF
ncbi:hypothetical protein H6G00_13565 [Leptolyngbya sp. FACHB-541]|nr:hypothetical protein [Leptolyngbya sp. FACHB-541]MBD1997643.1 hypothetical protein [Leptolyngbya sp. FACHB-541]